MDKPEYLTERQSDVLLARISEQAERYPEMVRYMKKVAEKYKTLTVDERNLLSVAYKNLIGTGRASWRLVLSIENKEESRGNKRRLELVREYKEKIESELDTLCQEVLELCQTVLLENASDDESRVFYHKMAGDYDRYLAEFTKDERRSEVAQAAHDEYRQATTIAQNALSPTHPIRLGLALNFSVFYYEILNSASRACILAKQAFDDAIAELDSLPEELYRDSTLIMQLLRDNLTFWQGDLNESEGKTAEAAVAAEPAAAVVEPAAAAAAASAEPEQESSAGAAAAAEAAAVDAPVEP